MAPTTYFVLDKKGKPVNKVLWDGKKKSWQPPPGHTVKRPTKQLERAYSEYHAASQASPTGSLEPERSTNAQESRVRRAPRKTTALKRKAPKGQ